MDNLEPITRNEMFLNGDDLEPITREEMILAGADLEPITRHEWFLKKYRGGGGGGGYDLVNVPNLPADIASFNDGTDLPMASLKVAVTPYQDLHGYDGPWVGGAGKNKLDFTDTTVTSSRTIASDISLKAGDYIVAFDIKNNSNIEGYYQVRIGTTEIGGVNFGANYSGRLSKTFTLSEDSVINIFVAGASSGYSFEFSKGQIELGSSATTYEPYSNICPIIGWDEAVVTRTGKNLWGGEKLADDIVAKVPQAAKDTTNKTVTYHASQVTGKVLFDNFKENTQYTIYLSTSNQYTNIGISYADGSSETIAPNTYKTTLANKTITQIVGRWATGSTVLNYEECGVFEGVITAEDFEPYNGATYTIDLDGTRYGGTLDATNGTLTVDWVGVDLSSLSWNSLDYYRYQTTINDMKTKDIRSMDIVCSCYKTNVGGSAYDDGTIYNASSPNRIIIVTSLYSNITDFQNSLSGQTAVYELATPITVQLAPTQVKSLEGENNIFANCGQITEVKYFKKA